MYHKGTIYHRGYYDTIDELPQKVNVYFPDEKEPKEMTPSEVCELDDMGWFTIMHSVNWGICDHWTSEKPSTWVRERFNRVVKLKKKNGEVMGYYRADTSIRLTKDGKYWKSEVWNS